jgi:hypothetical protein
MNVCEDSGSTGVVILSYSIGGDKAANTTYAMCSERERGIPKWVTDAGGMRTR